MWIVWPYYKWKLRVSKSTYLFIKTIVNSSHVNINNIFMENKWHCFIFFWKSPHNWLKRKQRHSHTCFCIKSVVICFSGWIIYRKFGFTQIRSWTWIILIAFLDNYEYSPLILYWTDDGFLKVSCNMESETIPMNFPYSVTWKSTGLSHTLNGFYLCMIL